MEENTVEYFTDSVIKRIQRNQATSVDTRATSSSRSQTLDARPQFNYVTKSTSKIQDENKYNVVGELIRQVDSKTQFEQNCKKSVKTSNQIIGGHNHAQQQKCSIGDEVIEMHNCKDEEARLKQALLDRLKNANYITKMNEIGAVKVHDPKQCSACVKKSAELLEKEFLRSKRNKLENKIIDVKVDNAIYTTDITLIIGDSAASLPKHSEQPAVIWKKLLNSKPTF